MSTKISRNFTTLPTEVRQVILYNAFMGKWRPFYRYLTAHCSRSHLLHCASEENKKVCIVHTTLEKKLKEWEKIETFVQDMQWLKKKLVEGGATAKHPHCAAVDLESVLDPFDQLPAECWGSFVAADDMKIG